MKRILATLVIATAALSTFAQTTTPATSAPSTPPTVSVAAKGLDVRDVLSDLFNQSKKNFVLQPNIRFALYLSLTDMEFEEALQLICKTAGLSYELQNGIYFVSRAKSTFTPSPVVEPAKPLGKIPFSDLRKKVTTTANKVDIRMLFKTLALQTGVTIDVNPKIPDYKLDATLKAVTLKFALETVCKAANLHYRLTDSMSIEIYPSDPDSHVTLHLDNAGKG